MVVVVGVAQTLTSLIAAAIKAGSKVNVRVAGSKVMPSIGVTLSNKTSSVKLPPYVITKSLPVYI